MNALKRELVVELIKARIKSTPSDLLRLSTPAQLVSSCGQSVYDQKRRMIAFEG